MNVRAWKLVVRLLRGVVMKERQILLAERENLAGKGSLLHAGKL